MIEPMLEHISERLKEIYDIEIDVLNSYMDLAEEDKKIIALWCIVAGTKDAFPAIPFMFLNASKGSGKTRLLKIMEYMTLKAKMTPNLTEASLKRLPSQEGLNALLIDEAERLTSKEKATIRELANQAYKKGGKVIMVEEIMEKGIKKRVVKEYPVYLALVFANIWGLESVLEDRCLTIILKKSDDPALTKIPEYFDLDPRFRLIRDISLVYVVYVGSCVGACMEYIFYSFLYHYHTLYTLHTYTTLPTLPTLIDQPLLKEEFLKYPTNVDIIFKNLLESKLIARDMELWMPLIVVAAFISTNFMKEIIEIAERRSMDKKAEEIISDDDTIFANFLCYYLLANGHEDYISVTTLKNKFQKLEGEKEWLKVEWIGKCLRRLAVIKNKKRMARGIEVQINMDNLKNFLSKRGITIDDSKITEYKDQLESDKWKAGGD